MSLRLTRRLEALWRAAGRRFPQELGIELVTHGILPNAARIVGVVVIGGIALSAHLPSTSPIAMGARYFWVWNTFGPSLPVGVVIVVPVAAGLLLLLVNHLISRPLTSSFEERVLRLGSFALLVISMPCADVILVLLTAAAALTLAVLFAPRIAHWLGLVEFYSDTDPDTDPEGR